MVYRFLPQPDTKIDYSVCKNCPNNPDNGGSGFCACESPYHNSYTGDSSSYTVVFNNEPIREENEK